MTTTLRTSRVFRGSPISLLATSQVEERSNPISLSDFLKGNDSRRHTGSITTGDVACTWHMDLWSNGFWTIHADLHDDGLIAGDEYRLTFTLGSDHAVGTSFQGVINVVKSRHAHADATGNDQWIRDHWGEIADKGPAVTLHAAVDVGALITYVALAVATVGLVVFFADNRPIVVRPCIDQNPPNPACMEMYHPEAAGGPPDNLSAVGPPDNNYGFQTG